jgi:cytochrome c biogenesis protein CcmG/thiol:disulfide interchange protein DsbE
MRYLPFLLFLSLACLLTFFLYVKAPVEQNLVGTSIPELSLPVYQQAEKAKPDAIMIYNLFASWCVPCISELPLLRHVAAPDVQIVGIAWKDKPEALEEWLHRFGNPYDAIYLDNNGHYGLALGMRGVPESFIVDQQGIIRHHHVGPLTDADMAQWQTIISGLRQ